MTTKKTSTARAAAQDAMKPVEAAVTAGKETVEAVMKAGTDAATKQYEQAVAMTKEQVEKASTSVFQNYDEFTAINKANMDAVVASTTSMAKGFEAITKEFFAYAQGSMESGLATTKKAFGVKSVQELMDLQSDYARANFDTALAESAKLTEMSMQVANEAFEPITARMHVTVEKMMKPIAA